MEGLPIKQTLYIGGSSGLAGTNLSIIFFMYISILVYGGIANQPKQIPV